MYHAQVRRKIRERRVLHEAMLELTFRCNLDCFFCYNDKDAQGEPLRLEQYQRLLEDLARMQVLFLTLTGGEPMVHPDFFALGRIARDLGFAIRLRTNGHLLRRPVAERLQAQVDPFMVEMSLHGARPRTHDRQTRLPGSFERLTDNVQGMRDLGLRQSLVSTLTAWNQDEVEEMFALADDLGVPLRFQGPVGARDNGDRSPLQIQPAPEAWERYLQVWESRRQVPPGGEKETLHETDCVSRAPGWRMGGKERLHCGTGSEEIHIDPFGNVYPCLHLRWPAGNLHHQSIEEIWNRSPVFGRARELSAQTAHRLEGRPITQLGAPVLCPALDLGPDGCGKGKPELRPHPARVRRQAE